MIKLSLSPDPFILALGAVSSAFQHMFNDENILSKISSGLSKSFSTLNARKGEVFSDAKEGISGFHRGYRQVLDSEKTPIFVKVMLKVTLTATEMGATARLSGWAAVSYDAFSGVYFDTLLINRAGLAGFYTKYYIDKSLGTEPVHLSELNPYK